MSRLEFITAIPWDVRGGSGCYVGTSTLVDALRHLGIDVNLVTPRIATPFYAATRVLFNETLRWRHFRSDATVGIDADGYAIAGRPTGPQHIACIKGVLGDAVRFERGATRASMAFQARLEAKHARRAVRVITVSEYCVGRLEELYGVRNAVLVGIDRFDCLAPAIPRKPCCSGQTQIYSFMRVPILSPQTPGRATAGHCALARSGSATRAPNCRPRPGVSIASAALFRTACREHRRWLGDLSQNSLATEYNRSDVFCLPSVQEGFGIVFLEAMAAGKPIVAARAAAVPEVVHSGILVQPGDAEDLAEGILRLYRDPDLRESLAVAGLRAVEQFEMRRVATRFISEVAKIVPAIKIADGLGAEHAN